MTHKDLVVLEMNLAAGNKAINDVRQAYIDLELYKTDKYGRPSDYISESVCNYARDAAATIAAQAAMLADYRTFYQYMVSNDYQNDLMDLLKDDMSADPIHSDEYQLAVSVWADYDALLTALLAHEAELKGKEETE